jgi:RNA 2',3'-cyclic 3'-phosphodiesterase
VSEPGDLPERPRLFVAVSVPLELLEALDRELADLRRELTAKPRRDSKAESGPARRDRKEESGPAPNDPEPDGPVRRGSSGRARWAPVSNQHITLKFLGSMPRGELAGLTAAFGPVCAAGSGGRVALGDLGAFPRLTRARVLWAGIDDPANLLATLAARLDEALEPLGFEPEKRAFTPHLTLARMRSPSRLPELPQLPETLRRRFPVTEVGLFLSRLHPKGARYELLRAFELGSNA